MLRIKPIKSAQDAKRYYTEALSRQDYYVQGQEIAGRWNGKLAQILGLSGDVKQETFFLLADNKHPFTEEKLTPRQKKGRRSGFDINVSVPKSVSLLHAWTGDTRILEAIRASVHETMQEIEARMQTRVDVGGSQPSRTTGNLLYADFLHTLSRPVEGIPDPDLHVHCFVFNATYDHKEQRIKAADMYAITQGAPYFEAAFHARLAARMRTLGYGIERNGKWWDIAGIPRDLIDKFSRRKAVIEAKAAALGVTDPRIKGELGARTREAKRKDLDDTTLKTIWESWLSPEDRKAREEVLSGAGTDASGAPEISPEESLNYAEKDCFYSASVVTEEKLLETALRRSFGHVLPEMLKDAAARAGYLSSRIGRTTWVTTRERLAEEQAMLAFARSGRGTCRALNREAGERFTSAKLNAGQQAAVRHVLTSTDKVMMIRGEAGVGKTTLMKEVVPLIEAEGKQVFTFTPGGETAYDVLKKKEGFKEADTVARLLVDEVLQERTRGNVIWIDEAGMLSLKDTNAVFGLAKRLDCRVVFSGDTKQHQSVAASAMRLLETRAGIRPAEVTEIVRQEGAYREAVAAIAKGKIEEGFQRLDKLKAIIEVPEDNPHVLLCRDYLQALKEGKKALIVSPTHREAGEVTALLRTALKAQEKIGQQDRPFFALRNLNWNEAVKSDPARYRQGLVVQFFQNARGITKGERFRITERDREGRVHARSAEGKQILLPLAQAQRFQVYEPYQLNLAAGDALRFTQRGKVPGGRTLFNGTVDRVKGFTKGGDIVLEGGGVVPQDFCHIAHGYCTTSHASQGKTVQQVFIAQSSMSFIASFLEQFYVSMSRGFESVRIYTDDRHGLQKSVKESGQRVSATELVEGAIEMQHSPLRLKPLSWEALRDRYRRYQAQWEKVTKSVAPPLELVKHEERIRQHGGTVMER